MNKDMAEQAVAVCQRLAEEARRDAESLERAAQIFSTLALNPQAANVLDVLNGHKTRTQNVQGLIEQVQTGTKNAQALIDAMVPKQRLNAASKPDKPVMKKDRGRPPQNNRPATYAAHSKDFPASKARECILRLARRRRQLVRLDTIAFVLEELGMINPPPDKRDALVHRIDLCIHDLIKKHLLVRVGNGVYTINKKQTRERPYFKDQSPEALASRQRNAARAREARAAKRHQQLAAQSEQQSQQPQE